MRTLRGVIVCVAVAVCLAMGSPAAICRADELKSPLCDGFDGKLALAWQPVREDKSHVSLSKHPGKLTIITQRGSIHGDEKNDAYGGGIQAKNIFLIRNPLTKGGDFAVITCIESFHPTTFWQQAGLIVYDDDDNYLKWDVEWNAFSGRRTLVLLRETEQASQIEQVVLSEVPERLWLRLVKRGEVYQPAYSADGKAFQVVGERRWGSGAPKRVGILAKNGGNPDAPEIDAQFESFEMRPLTTDEKGHAADIRKLAGTWIGVSRREDGREVEAPQRLQFAFQPTGSEITEGERMLRYQYALDVTGRPKQLILSSPGEIGEIKLLRMAYLLENDKLVLCFDPRPALLARLPWKPSPATAGSS